MSRELDRTMSMEPIGFIESCYTEKFGTPRQSGLVKSSWGRIKLYEQFQPEESLLGLEQFSHCWIIFWFHQNTNLRFHAKVHPPRLEGLSVGVFATRSPHRPNPLGLSLVKIEGFDPIDKNALLVSGVDVVSGTPILDIKPYLFDVESPSQTKSGWAQPQSLPPRGLQVCVEKALRDKISAWGESICQPQLLNIIVDTIALDPRPNLYRQDKTKKYRESHIINLFGIDVHFWVDENSSAHLSKICWDGP